MGRKNRLASTYADAINVFAKTPEFLHRSIRQRPVIDHKFTFKEQIKQQKLPAWRPTYDRNFIISATFILGLICLGIGIVMKQEIDKTLELEKGLNCSIPPINTGNKFVDICYLNVTKDINGDVMFSYRWNGVLQQHRMFSRRMDGLDYDKNNECFIESQSFFDRFKLNKFPTCGSGINTNFEDEYQLCSNVDIVPFTSNGILFDKKYNFIKDSYSCAKFDSSCWPINFTKLDPNQKNDYHIWQRKSAFSNFRKPYRRLDRNSLKYANGLPSGIYKLKAKIRTAVNNTDPKKSREFLITRISWLGIRNPWFANLYIIVGVVYIVVGFILLIIHKKFGKTLEQKCNANVPTTFYG